MVTLKRCSTASIGLAIEAVAMTNIRPTGLLEPVVTTSEPESPEALNGTDPSGSRTD
jgi:hypothetical protein